ncbi:unnamed protein product [Moneuplotes crassus]|uniref:Uncharacterized protein n=1 Tax=Euplotes crassus TaxID=5936 RepID=A0AAD1Y1E2_EUPCR|nr:unnamed protein product [Moneuplotes crassus]
MFKFLPIFQFHRNFSTKTTGWIYSGKQGVFIDLIVKPKARVKQTCITETTTQGVVVKVPLPPTDNKVNNELARYFTKILNCDTSIAKGHKSRKKTLICATKSDCVEIQTILKHNIT